jgi:hypothetical protein
VSEVGTNDDDFVLVALGDDDDDDDEQVEDHALAVAAFGNGVGRVGFGGFDEAFGAGVGCLVEPGGSWEGCKTLLWERRGSKCRRQIAVQSFCRRKFLN